METEFDVLLLDHRLRDIDEILDRLHDGESQRAQLQIAALDFGYIQDIVDEREQMIACQTDLPEALLGRLHITGILLGQSRQTDDRIHGSADVVRHCGEEVRLCLIRRFSLPCSDLKVLVKVKHIEHVTEEQDEQTC